MVQLVFATLGDAQEVLRLRDAPTRAPGPEEVRVRVRACPIHPADELFVRGEYRWRPVLPQVGGLEGAGVVDAAGPGAPIRPGARVSFRAMGTWSQWLILPAAAVTPVPDTLPFEQACQLSLNATTAWALLEEARLQPADWLLLTGGASTVNLAVIQLARERGVRTICTVRSAAKLSALLAAGATEVLEVSDGDLAGAVNRLTGGQGVAGCFEAVGGPLASVAYRCLAVGGRMLVYGRLSREDGAVNNATVISRGLTIRGFDLDAWLAGTPEARKATVRRELIEKLETGKLRMPVARAYPLEQFREAIRHARRGVLGKVLLTPQAS